MMPQNQFTSGPDSLEALQARIRELETQVALLRNQLVQSQRLSSIGALAASITHEFNNILMTTINYARMGLRNQDDATRTKAFDKILSAGQRASRITTGMLSFARGQGDRLEPTELEPVVREILLLAEKDLLNHRVHCQVEVIGNPVAEINTTQIQQVLLNLIVNARQAMTQGGDLRIVVRENQRSRTAEIMIRDSGPGMTPDTIRKIFEPFYSTKQRDETGRGGTGLGLALCKDIIEAHQGKIRVDSTPGVGTAFTLRFPLVAPATLAAAG